MTVDITIFCAKQRRLRGPTTVAVRARIVELSITGALIAAPSAHTLHVGEPITIEVTGHRADVIVRRALGMSRDGGLAYYGIEFRSLSPRLTEIVAEAVSGGGEHDWIWYTAR